MEKKNSALSQGIKEELSYLYQRIESNADEFGMSIEEVNQIKKQCALAYRHKVILDKVQDRKAEQS